MLHCWLNNFLAALSFCSLTVMAQSKIKEPGQEVQSEADVAGTWYNELGLRMEILCHSPDGTLEGKYYNSAPGSPELTENLVGKLGTETGVPATLGFIVNFEGGKYTTAWSGLYYNESACEEGEVLLTTWIMTAHKQDRKEYWEATNVGQDRFTRKPPAGKRKGRKRKGAELD